MSNNRAGIKSMQLDKNSNFITSRGGSVSSYGRVVDVLLDNDIAKAKNMNVKPGSIGVIEFRFLIKGIADENSPTQTAYCLNPNRKAFPIKNELVEIISGPTIESTNSSGNNIPTFYYKDTVDVWGSSEHNSIPTDLFDTRKSSVTGDDFKESGKIAKLIHNSGDIVDESRFGSSVRMGTSNSKSKAPWSGEDNSPIYIIRNGQGVEGDYIFEDINKDGTSLYFTSTQKIEFNPANLNFDSYNQEVTTAEKNNIVVQKKAEDVPTKESVVQLDNIVIPTKDSFPEVTYKTTNTPTKKEEDEELNFVPDKEDPIFYQELEDVIVGKAEVIMSQSIKPEYVIKVPTSTKDGVERVPINSIKPLVKGNFGKLPFKNFSSTHKTLNDFVSSLNELKNNQSISVNIARSLLAIGINEQSGTRGFNNNFFGIHSDIGSFRRSGRFSYVNPDHQVLAREGETGNMRAYLGFTNFKDALLYIADVLYAKGFGLIKYGPEEEDQFTRLYIDKWWGRNNVPADIYNLKKIGYTKAKKLIV